MLPQDIQNKNIVIAMLNWGLGHLMRSIPIIKSLQKNGNKVLIACDSSQKKLLAAELNEIETVALPLYDFKFSGKGNFGRDMARSFFTLHRCLRNERKNLSEIIKKHAIDIVISDQRLGFYNKNITSVLISHQLSLPIPWFQKLFQLYYNFYTNQFDFIWIPDAVDPQARITGKLTETNRENTHFIGFQSRFEKIEITKKYVYGAIISGPPPYNKQFLDLILQKFKTLNVPCFIITTIAEEKQIDNVKIIHYKSTQQVNQLIQQAEVLVSRSGYSTIMDLKVLDTKAILIPTPGQYEQLYLGKLLLNDSKITVLSEKGFQKLETL